MKKRGLSPVIATVLLIAIVIVIGLIVFLWFKGMTEEAITKFDGLNVKVVCEDVSFDASYDGGFIYLSNTGNVPIYKLKALISGDGTHETKNVGDDDQDWPKEGLNQGGAYSGLLSAAGTKMILIPVLVGTTSEGEKAHTCEERHGIELVI